MMAQPPKIAQPQDQEETLAKPPVMADIKAASYMNYEDVPDLNLKVP